MSEKEIRNELHDLIKQQASLREQFQSKAQELFKKTTKQVFEQIPQLKAIVWVQYTPYFNDGEECYFSVGEPTFTNADGEDLDDVTHYGEYDGDNESVWALETFVLSSTSTYSEEEREKAALTPEQVKAAQDFASVIQSNEFEDVMLAMFGDHVKVVATADGFQVDDYDHD